MVCEDIGNVAQLSWVHTGKCVVCGCKDGVIALLECAHEGGGGSAECSGERSEAGTVEGCSESRRVVGIVLSGNEASEEDERQRATHGERW